MGHVYISVAVSLFSRHLRVTFCCVKSWSRFCVSLVIIMRKITFKLVFLCAVVSAMCFDLIIRAIFKILNIVIVAPGAATPH